ncbi:hypothetical protein ACFUEN_29120 [Streptomyces griseorubiginosus]|uniref:hypothetical protein n=1 Tax=Streptomyces griseorubiginosus TaxID=67304 RepID=UPI0036382274
MPETCWNGEPCTARPITAIVTDTGAFPGYWARHLVGTRRAVVEITYGEQTFYIDNADGSGWHKVTRGGSPHWAHSSITIDPATIQPADPYLTSTEVVSAATHNATLQQLRQTEAERDGAYRERARLVALAVGGLAEQVVVAPAPDIAEPGWQIIYATLHGRQCSWHIAPRDAGLFSHFDHVPVDDPRAQWDGHTTEEKYEHLDHIARALGTPGPFRKA